MPFQIEDYVHRIGRTARGGTTGSAYSLFTSKNFMLAPELIKVIFYDSKNIVITKSILAYPSVDKRICFFSRENPRP